MFQSRIPLLHQGCAKLGEKPHAFIRCLSATDLLAQTNTPRSDTRGVTTSSTSNSSETSQARPRRPIIPPARLNPRNTGSDRPLPRRVIDARSLAAGRSGSQPTNIIRGPRLRTPQNLTSARSRGPRPPTQKSTARDRTQRRTRNPSDVDTDEAIDGQGIEDVFRELEEQAKPVSVRYDPEPVTLDSLRETWPSLPTDVGAHTAGVAETLSSISARFADGYVSPTEMGKRLFQGRYVRFLDEEEKSFAVAEARRLSQSLADKLSQRKGDLVEPIEVTFSPIDEKDRKTLIELLVQGKYPATLSGQSAQSPVLDQIATNLKNNGSYLTAGKDTQFFAKVESLLTSGRPTRRV
ncbi:uncharacterized protein BO95DRAFT_92309 [Aspergillus brunneoviolaceus CBS 621.78]|uniref:Uncharacterized protein n=1 Tax=Aspergillus brunneoviolaceus CBS 621.78 TaxID=1450534 RepID=A0ACD1GCD4_9EURO|nr:hypothetical protein BO95DRAFT_92309 [Aspergillus brunneoviolaceus CBS 621.78]RAH46932.1 hypothetical protein BO95DRAFT_92309 [Aspergillus brunneoviolaceus CBS 621.78]